MWLSFNLLAGLDDKYVMDLSVSWFNITLYQTIHREEFTIIFVLFPQKGGIFSSLLGIQVGTLFRGLKIRKL